MVKCVLTGLTVPDNRVVNLDAARQRAFTECGGCIIANKRGFLILDTTRLDLQMGNFFNWEKLYKAAFKKYGYAGVSDTAGNYYMLPVENVPLFVMDMRELNNKVLEVLSNKDGLVSAYASKTVRNSTDLCIVLTASLTQYMNALLTTFEDVA